MNSRGFKLSLNKYRIIFGGALLLSGFFLPIGFFIAIGLIGVVLFDRYFEPAVVFFIIEAIFGLPSVDWSPYPFLGTISFILLALLVQEIKRFVLIGN